MLYVTFLSHVLGSKTSDPTAATQPSTKPAKLKRESNKKKNAESALVVIFPKCLKTKGCQNINNHSGKCIIPVYDASKLPAIEVSAQKCLKLIGCKKAVFHIGKCDATISSLHDSNSSSSSSMKNRNHMQDASLEPGYTLEQF